MLNGIYPIFIFNFSKAEKSVQEAVAKIPIVSQLVTKIGLPPIPIYLDEKITGLCIAGEERSIEVQSSTETLTDGGTPTVDQKGIQSTVSINLEANAGSLGLTLFSALLDQVFEKVTSKEYTVTYLSGAVTVFNGLINRFTISQGNNSTKYLISIELIRAGLKTQPPTGVPVVQKVTSARPL